MGSQCDSEGWETWIMSLHAVNLFKRIQRMVPAEGDPQTFELSLVEMHRMKLLAIQCQLVGHARSIIEGNWPTVDWQGQLSDYVQAVQEYDYMMECSSRQRDPFLVSSTRTIDRKILKAVMRGFLPNDQGQGRVGGEEARDTDAGKTTIERIVAKLSEAEHRSGWESENEYIPMVGTRSHNRHTSLFTRLVAAAIGIAFLVGPMWLMMINTGFYTALIATTVFISAFGTMMACVLDRRQDVLAGTLAYAAVMVVFVGLVRSPT